MLGINLRGLWQLKQQAAQKTERKPPEKCVFCNAVIPSEGCYYLGYTKGHIYAETCDRYDCTKWLELKSFKLKKP